MNRLRSIALALIAAGTLVAGTLASSTDSYARSEGPHGGRAAVHVGGGAARFHPGGVFRGGGAIRGGFVGGGAPVAAYRHRSRYYGGGYYGVAPYAVPYYVPDTPAYYYHHHRHCHWRWQLVRRYHHWVRVHRLVCRRWHW
jgi:hypothetical protein